MRRVWPLLVFIIIATVLAAQTIWLERTPFSTDLGSPQRVISLSPSITEILFALGVEDRVVAVTDYCDYPPQAQELPSIGGVINANPERIMQFQPDLVIVSDSQKTLRAQLARLGINTLSINNNQLDKIQESIMQVSKVMDAQDRAEDLVRKIQQMVTAVHQRTKDLSPPRTMIAMAHYVHTEHLETVYIAGQNDFYNDLLELAGGKNVYLDPHIRIPSINQEGIISLNPDIVIDLFPVHENHQSDMTMVRQQWANLKAINAVKNNRVYIIEENYATIPGPRIFNLLLDFARILHPHIDWSDIDTIDI